MRRNQRFGCVSAPIRTVAFSSLARFKNGVGASGGNGGRATIEVKCGVTLFESGQLPGFIAFSASF